MPYIKAVYACHTYTQINNTYLSYIIQVIHTHKSHTYRNRSYIQCTYIHIHTYIQLYIKAIHTHRSYIQLYVIHTGYTCIPTIDVIHTMHTDYTYRLCAGHTYIRVRT